MSEQSDPSATGAPEGTDPTGDPQPKPTETVEFWRDKSREMEKRAKANAAAAKRLEEIEAASKTEAEKTAEALAVAQRDAEQARAEALRFRIASKFQVSDEDADLFLTGTDEETLTKQAQRLTDRTAAAHKGGNVVPREGTSAQAKDDDVREFARNLFAKAD